MPRKARFGSAQGGRAHGVRFGHAPRLGAPLARRELTWGFQAVVDRFDDMHFAVGANDFAYHPHFLLRSLKQLNINFEAKAR